jgi:hypothetical protein
VHDLNNQPEADAPAEEKRPAITLEPVTSNQVAAIGYDPATKTLAVTFTRGAGAIYHYPDVEPEAYEAFKGAESIGKHFGQHIKPLPFKKYAPEPVAETAQRITDKINDEHASGLDGDPEERRAEETA